MEIGMLIRIRNCANLKVSFVGWHTVRLTPLTVTEPLIHTKIAPLHHPGIKSMAESIDITPLSVLDRHTH